MKTFMTISIGALLSFSVNAEIWDNPGYQPDENHLPAEKEEQQEKTPSTTNPRKHQEIQDDPAGPSYTPLEEVKDEPQQEKSL
jgi:hypothetical protein